MLCLSFVMNFGYRLILVIIEIIQEKPLWYFVLDVFFIVRLLAIAIQHDQTTKLCFIDEIIYTDKDKKVVKIVSRKEKEEEESEEVERNRHEYFAQDNKKHRDTFTLF